MTYIGQAQINSGTENENTFSVGNKVIFKSGGKVIYTVVEVKGEKLKLLIPLENNQTPGPADYWEPWAMWFRKVE